MALALLRPAVVPEEIRGMTAVLRWRARWLLRHLPRREAQAVRLIPALLQASFAQRGLKADPPGVVGVSPRPSWVALARSFNLPPPTGSQRGQRLIAAILVTPTRDRLEVIAVLEKGLGAREQDRARLRLEAAQALLTAEGIALHCQALTIDEVGARVPASLLAFGCLFSGRLDPSFFDRLAAGQTEGDAVELWTRAPTPLARLCLMFLAGGGGPLPFAALWKMLAHDSARTLADPELFCARWAATRPGVAGTIHELVSQAARQASTRALLLRELGHLDEQPSVRALLAIGRATALRLARAVRAVRGVRAGPLRRAFRKEVSGAGIPNVLLSMLGASLKASRPPGPQRWLFEVRALPGVTQVHDADGAVLGQGAAPAQAWVRALALVGRALGKAPVVAGPEPMFARLGGRLLQPAERRTVIVLVEAQDLAGVPHDPLNRGADRTLAVRAALVVTLTPDGRPAARRVLPFDAVGRLILEASAGTAVEVLGGDGKSDVTAARLARVTARCRGHTSAHPLLIEVAGQGVTVAGNRLLRFPLRTVAARPRAFVADPEAWDFGAAAAAGRPSRSGPRALDCLVWAVDPFHACVWYSTDDGAHLSERVPFASLEQHMAETQRLARSAQPPLVLAVRTAPEIAERISRFDPQLRHVVALDIGGRLPFGLTVGLGGERFGAGTGLGFRAAAETILSQWPPQVLGHLTVGAVELAGHGADGALAKLYARSLVQRRLWAHIRRACRPEGLG